MFKYLLFLFIGILFFILFKSIDRFSVSAEGDENEACIDTKVIEDKCNGPLACISGSCINPCKEVEPDRACSNNLCNQVEDPVTMELIDSNGVCLGTTCYPYSSIESDRTNTDEGEVGSNYDTYTTPYTRISIRILKEIRDWSACDNTEDVKAYSLRYNDASSSRSPIFYGASGVIASLTKTKEGKDFMDYMPGGEPYLGAIGATDFTLFHVDPVNSLELCNDDDPRCSDGLECDRVNGIEYCMGVGGKNQLCRSDPYNKCDDDLTCHTDDSGIQRCIRRGYINELCRPPDDPYGIPRCRYDTLECRPVNGVERCILAGVENKQCRTNAPRCVRLRPVPGQEGQILQSPDLSCEVDEDGIEKCLRRGGYHQRCMSRRPYCRDHLQCRLIQGDPYPTCRTRSLFGGVFGCAARPQEQP